MSAESAFDNRFNEHAELPALDDPREEAVFLEDMEEDEAREEQIGNASDDDSEVELSEVELEAEEEEEEQPLVSIASLGITNPGYIDQSLRAISAQNEHQEAIYAQDLEVPPQNIWAPSSNSAVSRIKDLCRQDRTALEDHLKTWLLERYPLVPHQFRAVAARCIPLVRRHVAASSPYAEVKDGRLHTTTPTTSFAVTLLDNLVVPELNHALAGDEMLLAIGLAKNPELVEPFIAMTQNDTKLDRSAVIDASQLGDKKEPAAVYLLNFGWDRLYVGMSESCPKRLREHRNGNVNRFFETAKDFLEEANRQIQMTMLVSWPLTDVPRMALYGLETMFIACIGTNSGPLQMQHYSMGALPSPAIELRLIRPTWLRYIAKARESADSDQSLPAIRCFDHQHRNRSNKDTVEASIAFYSRLFEDLIQESGIDSRSFIYCFFGAASTHDRQHRIGKAIDTLENLGYRRIPSAHARAGMLKRKKYVWDIDMKGITARNDEMEKLHGRALAHRTMYWTNKSPFNPETDAQMFAKYSRLAKEYKALYGIED
ncbi:hypothetical protein IAU59_000674 [Kwoniella sp. CBS 9459]